METKKVYATTFDYFRVDTNNLPDPIEPKYGDNWELINTTTAKCDLTIMLIWTWVGSEIVW